MDHNLNQNVGVDDQEEQPSQPDPHKGVVAFKLQEVGGTKPGPLQEGGGVFMTSLNLIWTVAMLLI